VDTAFIGIDYIIDLMHPAGRIAACAAEAQRRQVVARANRALATARDRGWLTVLVRAGFQPGYADHPADSPLFGRARECGALVLGGRGTEFHPDLDAAHAELVVCKPRVSAFYCTNLDAALRARGIRRVVIAGVSTTWAVQSAARDAHDRDLAVVILEDACAAASQEEHDRSMAMLTRIARIASTDDLSGL
jgi:nicotinamidase-related amidase